MKHLSKLKLEHSFLSMCASKGLGADSISSDSNEHGWFIDVAFQNRRFLFQTDSRDGYTFHERKGAGYIDYSLDTNEPYFAEDENLLMLSVEMIGAALADPAFRGYRPKII